MKKRVLVSSSYPAPYRVGVFQELCKTYDMEVFFSTTKDENRNADWFCKCGDLTFEILDNPTSRGHFQKALDSIAQYDFVLLYDYTMRASLRAAWQCRRHSIPFYLNCDGVIYHSCIWRRIVKRIVYPFLFKNATGCFASCQAAIEHYKRYGASPDKIFKHNFTSLEANDILTVPPNPEEKTTWRERLNLPMGPLMLSIGQFIPRKGFDILLRAWKSAPQNASLLIIGGGDDKPLYEKMIHDENIHNVIIKDFMKKAELFNYYKAADAFVLPTREDIWGLVINEAMAQGLPVISTDNCIAGIELIENSKNGFIVKTESVDDLAEKINVLLSQKELMANMAINNLQKISSWTMANIAKSHVEAIEKTLPHK